MSSVTGPPTQPPVVSPRLECLRRVGCRSASVLSIVVLRWSDIPPLASEVVVVSAELSALVALRVQSVIELS